MFGGRDGRRRGAAKPDEDVKVSIANFNWKRVFGYLRPYWKRMTVAVITLLVSTALGLTFPLIIMQLLGAATQDTSYAPLNMLTAMLIGVFLFQAAFTFLQNYL